MGTLGSSFDHSQHAAALAEQWLKTDDQLVHGKCEKPRLSYGYWLTNRQSVMRFSSAWEKNSRAKTWNVLYRN